MKWLRFAPLPNLDPEPELTFDALWNLPAVERITCWRTSDVSRISVPTRRGTPIPAYRKRYHYPGFSSKWKGLFRNTFFGSSRAAREDRNLRYLHRAGLSRIRVLAVGEHRILRFLSGAMIVTEAAEDTLPLDALLQSEGFRNLDPEPRRRFAAALGRWVAALHGRGYRDRGLKARNILVHGEGRRWTFSKIDSPKGRGGREIPFKNLVCPEDLRDLWPDLATLTDRTWILRALLAYRGAGEVDNEVRSLARRVLILDRKRRKS